MIEKARGLIVVLASMLMAACSSGGGPPKPKPTSLQFDAASFTVSEVAGAATITVTRTGDTGKAVSVDFATFDISAVGGADYVSNTGTLSWADGDGASKTFLINIIDDFLVEGNELLQLALSSPTGPGASTGVPASVFLTINDDDQPGSLQLTSSTYRVGEADGSVTISVSRTGGVGDAVSVDFSAAAGTASAGPDFTPTSGTLNWAAGDAADKTFSVTINDDGLAEGDETIDLSLGNPAGGATLGAPQAATLTILDDEVFLQFTSATYQVAENGGSATISVSRVGGTIQAVGVSYVTSDVAAVAGSDYTAASGVLSWGAGDVADKSFTVDILDDFFIEADEGLAITLNTPTGSASLGFPAAAVLTITNDDVGGSLEFGAATYQVGETGVSIDIDVIRTGGVGNDVTVDFATIDQSATAGMDYVAASGMLMWPAGDATPRTFTVDISDDPDVEGEEMVRLDLTNAMGGATLGAVPTAMLTILDDEVTLQFGAATYQVAENGGSVTINVTRLGGLSQAVGVSYATSDNSATASSDYTAASGTLSWGAGDGADKVFTIDVTDESMIEGDEMVDLTLSVPTGGATLGMPSTAALTITNDDTTIQFDMAAYPISETAVSIDITVTRSGATPGPVSAMFGTSDGTATAGMDYTSNSGTINWAGPDTTSRMFTVLIGDDSLAEGDETIDLSLSGLTGGATLGSPGAAVIDIIDDDVSLEFTSATYQVLESDLIATITVARRGILAGAVDVDFGTSNGSALDGLDYTMTSGTLSWPDMDGANKSFTVAILDNSTPEPVEFINLALSNPMGGATLGLQDTAEIEITDDEGTIQFAMLNFQVSESGVTATVTLTRLGDLTNAVTVDYATADGTAMAGSDYTGTSGTLSWLAGDGADKTFTVDILGDPDPEADETVDLTLSNPGGGAFLGSPSTAVLTIVDDDVAISGTITYDLVPTSSTIGLDYANTVATPSRGVVVEAVRSSDGTVLSTTTTSSAGDYSVVAPANTTLYVRVKAQTLRTGSPAWDYQVVDNTNGKALYSSVTADFDSGTVDITNKDVHMPSGWGGSSYTSPRSAAPFAVLGVVYDALQKVLAADAFVSMPRLLINWSVNNIPTSGDRTIGEIGGAHYTGGAEAAVYLLGAEDINTDEYDALLVAHEWGHYFHHRLSRNDTLGGSWNVSQRLDARTAFSEGFADAIAGIMQDDPLYIDTDGVGQGDLRVLQNLDDNFAYESAEGWFSPRSVGIIIYDLNDASDDGADTISMGFAPIYDVMVSDLAATDSFVTIHPFLTDLKQNNPGDAPLIDILTSGENVSTVPADDFDSTATETNDGGEPTALPMYSLLAVGGGSASLCSNGNNGNYNKHANRKYFYFQIGSSGSYTITAVPDVDGDPKIRLWSSSMYLGSRDSSGSGVLESWTRSLVPGTYIGEVYHVRHVDGADVTEECFDVSIN